MLEQTAVAETRMLRSGRLQTVQVGVRVSMAGHCRFPRNDNIMHPARHTRRQATDHLMAGWNPYATGNHSPRNGQTVVLGFHETVKPSTKLWSEQKVPGCSKKSSINPGPSF